MATGTDSRNIKVIIQAIMQSNGIDNLKAEVDIFGAWMRYMNERAEGLTPAQVREKIAKEYNAMGQSAENESKIDLQKRMETVLGLTVDVGSTSWETVFNFCLKQQEKGETIEKFWAWCLSDQYNSPKKHQIAQNPLLIKVMWRSAFSGEVPQKTDRPNLVIG